MERITDTPENELIQALADALENAQAEHEANTITSSEFAAALGLSQSAARRRLNKLRAQGVIVPEKVTRENAWGDVMTVNGYRYVEAS